MDYLTMEAGREMDALVAEKVFGYKVEYRCEDPLEKENPDYRTCSPPYGCEVWAAMYWRIPDYSTSISDAWEVVEKMGFVVWPTTQGNWFIHADRIDEEYGDEYWFGGKKGIRTCGTVAPTAPLAICRAALKAAEKWEG